MQPTIFSTDQSVITIPKILILLLAIPLLGWLPASAQEAEEEEVPQEAEPQPTDETSGPVNRPGIDPSEAPLQIQAYLPLDILPGGYVIGYYWGDSFYLGIQHLSGSISITDDSNADPLVEEWGQDGLESVNTDSGEINIIELRYIVGPIFFSLGRMATQGQRVRLKFKHQLRVIGNNAYETGLKVTARAKPLEATSYGMGFNTILDSGISFGVSTFFADQDPESEVSILVRNTDIVVDEEDLAYLMRKISRDSPITRTFFAGIFIGYNF